MLLFHPEYSLVKPYISCD